MSAVGSTDPANPGRLVTRQAAVAQRKRRLKPGPGAGSNPARGTYPAVVTHRLEHAPVRARWPVRAWPAALTRT
jgi:hypothetical protein